MRIPLEAYLTKGNRRKLTGAYSSASPIVGVIYEKETKDILIRSTDGRAILIKSSLIPRKSTRTAAGVQIMQFPRKKGKIELATDRIDELGEDALKCRKLAIPSMGVAISQLTFKF